MLAERVLHRFGVLLAKEWGLVAEETVQLLAGERQEGREQHLERVDRLEGGVDSLGCSLLVGLDGEPGGGGVEVFVDLGGQPDGFLQGRPQVHGLEIPCPQTGIRPRWRPAIPGRRGATTVGSTSGT